MEMAFRRCLYLHARWLAPLIRRFRPEFFDLDFRFIEYLGRSTSSREVNADVANFGDANRGSRNFWRTTMRLRVSGRKAARLAYNLLAEARLEPEKIPA